MVRHAYAALDAAVAAAYESPTVLHEEEVLARLLVLSLEREQECDQARSGFE